MITFNNFYKAEIIAEERTKYFSDHLSHLEDLAIERGTDGFKDFLLQVKNILQKISGYESETHINAKIDGSPAILFGLDPRPGYESKFFVGLKYSVDKSTDSIKADAKLIHSEEEANQIFGSDPSLLMKMRSLFNNLKRAYDGSAKIYQGDVLYAIPTDKKFAYIEGEPYITFMPNTILYAIPVDQESEIYNEINKSNVGVIVHDSFTSKNNKLTPAGKNFDSLISSAKNNRVFVRGSNYGVTKFNVNDKEIDAIKKFMFNAEKNINNIDKDFFEKYLGDSIYKYLQIFLNAEVDKEASGIFGAARKNKSFIFKEFFKEFSNFVSARIFKGSEKLQEKGKLLRKKKAENMLLYLKINQNNFENLLSATFEMIKIKNALLNILNQLGSKLTSTAFYQMPDGTFVKTYDEGFVLFLGNNQVKIVDRVNFTKMNRVVGGRYSR